MSDSLFVKLSSFPVFLPLARLLLFLRLVTFYTTHTHVHTYVHSYVAASLHGLTAFSRPHHSAFPYSVTQTHTLVLVFSLVLHYFCQFLLHPSPFHPCTFVASLFYRFFSAAALPRHFFPCFFPRRFPSIYHIHGPFAPLLLFPL